MLYSEIPEAEWLALDEANRLREGLPAGRTGEGYWTSFLREVQRIQT